MFLFCLPVWRFCSSHCSRKWSFLEEAACWNAYLPAWISWHSKLTYRFNNVHGYFFSYWSHTNGSCTSKRLSFLPTVGFRSLWLQTAINKILCLKFLWDCIHSTCQAMTLSLLSQTTVIVGATTRFLVPSNICPLKIDLRMPYHGLRRPNVWFRSYIVSGTPSSSLFK